MSDLENHYQVLEVDPEADSEGVRRAYHRMALRYHPDRLGRLPVATRLLAEEKIKAVNRAYEIVGDAEKRRDYDAEWRRVFSPPQPQVEPSRIQIDDALAGQAYIASFDVRNGGGPYTNIRVDNPESWVRVTGYESLTGEDELPLRVYVEAIGDGWGRAFQETIKVSLDGREARVIVALSTAPRFKAAAPPGKNPVGVTAGVTAGGAASAVAGRRLPRYWPKPPPALSRSIDGAVFGIKWGGTAGAAVTGVAAVFTIANATYSAFSVVLMAPGMAILGGVVVALLGAVVGGTLGATAGLVYGAISKR